MFGAIGAMMGSGPTSQIAGAYQQREADARTWEREKEMFRMEVHEANQAHQRQVKDLRAAGLNPILSANMSGAAVPSGNVHKSEPFWTPDKMAGLASSGQALDKLKQNQKTVDANAQAAQESVNTQRTQQELNEELKNKAIVEQGKAVADTKLSGAQALKTLEDSKGAGITNEIRKLEKAEKVWNMPAHKEQAGAAHLRGKMQNNNLIQAIHQLKSIINPLDFFKAVPIK